jgi:hypothetical protein
MNYKMNEIHKIISPDPETWEESILLLIHQLKVHNAENEKTTKDFQIRTYDITHSGEKGMCVSWSTIEKEITHKVYAGNLPDCLSGSLISTQCETPIEKSEKIQAKRNSRRAAKESIS